MTDPDRLHDLRSEWDALWARASAPRMTQSFAWCLAGWQTTGAPRGRRLHVVVMRAGGRAVLIWPMTLHRRRVWRVARALGPESTEYAPVLVESGAQAVERVRAAWAFVRRCRRADVVMVPFVRHDAALYHALSLDDAPRDADTVPRLFVGWDGIASWDAYWRSRSAKLRRDVARRRRRLAERGRVTSEAVESPDELRAVIAWTVMAKVDWLARKGRPNAFLRTTEFRDFLSHVADVPAPAGRLAAFVLRLDGRLVASQIVAVDGACCEAFITVYDPAFSAYSPSQLILADCLKWCHERGVIYDFRVGDEAYKYAWANADCRATTYRLAITPWGKILLVGAAWRVAWRQAGTWFRGRITGIGRNADATAEQPFPAKAEAAS